jgi:cysteine desulfurase
MVLNNDLPGRPDAHAPHLQMAATDAVYLDFAASTPCDDAVIEAILPFLRLNYGNPSNLTHEFGRRAYQAVEQARRETAGLVGCSPDEIIWTSGATEANNLAILGVVRAWSRTHDTARAHVVTSTSEHQSVLAACQQLEQDGHRVSYVSPDRNGVVTTSTIAEALEPMTCLVSLMSVNNELGTINEVHEVAELCHSNDVVMHCDGAQSVGRIPMNLSVSPISLLTCSGHKIYGPKGVGALVQRTRHAVRIEPLVRGGGQENGLRSGTLNVPGIVGMGTAAAICGARMATDAERLRSLQTQLETTVLAQLPEAVVNGSAARRAPHISNVSFPGDADSDLVEAVAGIACSSGSACESQDRRPSHVLRSIGVRGKRARNTLRLSYGRSTRPADIEIAAQRILDAVQQRGIHIAAH